MVIKETLDIKSLDELYLKNGLEVSEEEEVSTDMIKSWCLTDEDKGDYLAGGITLGYRQGEYIIDGIAVEKEYRKFDWGSKLLATAVDDVRARGGNRLFLVARMPEFFRRSGFKTVEGGNSPMFFECFTCPQYNVDCHPEVMRLDII